MIPRSTLSLRLLRRHGLLSTTPSCLCTSSPSHLPPSTPFNSATPSRHLHTLPPLTNNDALLARGIPGLFTPDALHQLWTLYMKSLLNRLNDLVAGDARENDDIKKLVINSARNPSDAALFNHASQAYNHHFFLDGLTPPPPPRDADSSTTTTTASSYTPPSMPDDLANGLARSFGSVHTFKDTLLTTAEAMFGPGYVWLVLQFNPSPYDPNTSATTQQHTNARTNPFASSSAGQPRYAFRILPTYLAGTPFPGAHERLQSRDLTTSNYFAEKAAQGASKTERPQNPVGAFGPDSFAQARQASLRDPQIRMWGGADVLPLLCVSTWQHAYIYDWGCDGKQYYLRAWWERVDWRKVWEYAQTGVAGGGTTTTRR